MTPSGLGRVLIVDDNPGDTLLLREMLGGVFDRDVKVETAASLGEALALLADRLPRLTLLDLNLPDSWGPQTFRTFQLSAPPGPVVVLTGLQDEALALALVREGAQDYLTKGQFDQAMLSRVVRYAWERQTIEAELLERRIWWETIIRAIPDAVIVSEHGRVVFVNEAAATLWNIPSPEFLGRPLDELYPGEVRGSQTAILTSDGREVPVELSHSSFRIGQASLLATVARDLSERRRLEQQLIQTQKMEAMGHLSAGIAHDFNNLLAVAMGNLELLKILLADQPDLHRRVVVAMGALTRGADLTKRLLAFSRAQDLRPRRVQVWTLMENILEMARRTLGPAIHIETRVDGQLPELFVDPSELENVLLNLTVNARDAMPNGGSLRFSAEVVDLGPDQPDHADLAPGRYVALDVGDTGTGMAPEVLEKAFVPFYTTKEKGKGTGLGLSMVYGFARHSGGAVRIESEVGRGTVVRLLLPVGAPSSEEATIHAPVDYRPPAGTRALVVDDEPELLEVAEAFLASVGVAVETASSGGEALGRLRDEPEFDLLMTDVLMPGMNGGQLAQAARELTPRIRVLFTTGFPSEGLSAKVVLDSVVVNKPYTRDDLVTALAQVLADRGEA